MNFKRIDRIVANAPLLIRDNAPVVKSGRPQINLSLIDPAPDSCGKIVRLFEIVNPALQTTAEKALSKRQSPFVRVPLEPARSAKATSGRANPAVLSNANPDRTRTEKSFHAHTA